MKYLVVEQSYEYNDEYNIIAEEGYTIKSKLYDNLHDATNIGRNEAILGLFKDWKGVFNSGNFDFAGFSYNDKCIKLKKYFDEKGWEYDKDNYQLFLPKDLSEDEVIKCYNMWELDLIKIIEVNE